MSFRTVVISSICKLDLKMGYLVIRGEETKRVFLDEISVLVIENSAVSITGCLIEELSKRKIKVIFCDSKHNPVSEIVPYYGSHDCSQKLKLQINWTYEAKGLVWTAIVAQKIRNQARLLFDISEQEKGALLEEYVSELEFYDSTNREGHAAKVYFNAVFGMDFTRHDDGNCINSALNYGYAIILSAVNREVVSNGYITQLGMFHDNMFNQFNLSCDIMEPLRIFVDRYVFYRKYKLFESAEKKDLLNLLNETVVVDSYRQTLLNAIKIYAKSVFDALNDNDLSKLKFPYYEL